MKSYKSITMICLLLFMSFQLFAQSDKPYSIKQVLSASFPSILTASSTGDKIAWVFNQEGKRNIWIADGPDFKAKQITDYPEDDGQGISNLIFAPGGSQVIYLRGGAPNRQGEIPNPTSNPDWAKRQLWKINIQGGEPVLIGEGSSPALSPNGKVLAFVKSGQIWKRELEGEEEAKKYFTIRGRASNLQWSPDGNYLAYVSNRGDHSFIGIYSEQNKNVKYLSPSVDRDGSPVWSPDSKEVAWIRIPNQKSILPFMPRRSSLPWSIMVGDVNTGKTKKAWEAKEGTGSTYRFISASNQLFWSASNHLVFPYEKSGWTHLHSISSNGGGDRDLTPGDFEVQFVAIGADNKTMLYSSNQNDIDRQHVWSVNIAQGSPEQITEGNGIEWSPVMTANSKTIFSLASKSTIPAHVAKLDNPGQIKNLVPNAIPNNFPSKSLVEPQQVIFSSADGMKIHGQLFLPKGNSTSKKPAILFFHGGSRRQMLLGFHHRGYYHNKYSINQYLASQGYIVLSVNYRSGIGYGMEFREALNYGARGASEYNDVLGAGLYLRSRDDVDPDKIGLWGGSYGGYLTALGLAKASDLFAAGVDLHGVHDWNVVIRNFSTSYDASKRADAAKLAFDSSPMAYMDTWESPVLLIHGDDDRNVPFSETVDLVESLRNQGVHFEQLIFADEVHGFLLHKNWLSAYEATVDFFNRMLKK